MSDMVDSGAAGTAKAAWPCPRLACRICGGWGSVCTDFRSNGRLIDGWVDQLIDVLFGWIVGARTHVRPIS